MLLCFFLTLLVSPFKSKSRLGGENAALRREVIILRRKVVVAFTSQLFASVLTAIQNREGHEVPKSDLASYRNRYSLYRTDADGPGASSHMLSSVDCITTTSESEFSVHTGVVVAVPILSGLHHHYVRK